MLSVLLISSCLVNSQPLSYVILFIDLNGVRALIIDLLVSIEVFDAVLRIVVFLVALSTITVRQLFLFLPLILPDSTLSASK